MKIPRIDKLSTRDSINLYILIMIFGAVFGFIYEEIFYYFDLGYLVKRGSTYGPWIPIYAFGGLFITLLTYRYKKKPLIVFLLATTISGIVEYGTALFFDKLFNVRLWDYNVEILNYGNINGYICLRSILFFGISGVFLVYVVIPLLKKIVMKYNKSKMNIVCTSLIFIFGLDILLHFIFVVKSVYEERNEKT